MPPAAFRLAAAHRQRLREVWRSAGWPCRDGIEAELLAGGLLERRFDDAGRETLRITEAGIAALAAARGRHRAAFDTHEALVARVALEMQRAGRIVWRGLSLRAPLAAEAAAAGLPGEAAVATAREPAATTAPLLDTAAPDAAPPEPPERPRWVIAMPDVYSIRHTTVEDYAEPVAHEIKVRRADLLADLRRPDKGAAYRALASQCWYVLARGIAAADELPAEYGVMFADATAAGLVLEVARPAPRRALRVPFAVWMALARADAERPPDDDGQDGLGAGGSAGAMR